MTTVHISTKSAEILQSIERKLGFIPNLIRELVISPAVAEVYLNGTETMAHASLTAEEQQVASLVVAAHNSCHYCTAAHQALGRKVGVAQGDLEAITRGRLPRDERLHAVVRATRLVLEWRGWLSEKDQQSLAEQGVDRQRLYEIIALIGLKTISTYINHIAHTEIDEEFRP